MSAIASRRHTTLRLLALGGAVAVGGFALRDYAPWTNYDAEADLPRQPFPTDPATRPRMMGLIRSATLAANGHNAQPWKFALSANSIEIHPDYSRRLPAVDPADREMWISLGCALENLLIAARAMGYAPEVTYPETRDLIHIHLAADTPQRDSLFDAIPSRQSTRSEYDGRLIAPNQLDSLQNLSREPGVGVHPIVERSGLATLADYVHESTLSQYADQAFRQELIQWLRFNKKEAVASLDGLYSACTGNPTVPRWLGQWFVAGAKPPDLAEADVKKLRSSAGAVVITSLAETKADWVRTGQVYERMALRMTSWNIKSAFLNQPVEVESVRGKLQSGLGLGAARPQLVVRFGYANSMLRSLRRPVEQVLMPT
jgi:hypothetical protein